MSKTNTPILFVLGSLLLYPTLLSAQPTGRVRVANLRGVVAVVNDLTGVFSTAQHNAQIGEGYTIVTGAAGEGLLLFSNGATISVSANTKIAISQFFQASYGKKNGLHHSRREPSRSTTRLRLDYGEIIGRVKWLHRESSYKIETPVGTAVIHGTDWIIHLRPITTHATTCLVVVVNGVVDFIPPGADKIEIRDNQQIEITLTQDASHVPRLDVSSLGNLSGALRERAIKILATANSALESTFESGGEPTIVLPEMERQYDPTATLGGHFHY